MSSRSSVIAIVVPSYNEYAILSDTVLLLYVLYSAFFGYTVAGLSSLTMIVLLFSVIQLISIGVIGESIAKTCMEIKYRPRYFISERLESTLKGSDNS